MNTSAIHPQPHAMRWAHAGRRCLRAGLLVLRVVGVACAGGSAWALESTGAELDTLFYSPAQRASIVGARQSQSGASVLGTVQQLTGVVRRSGGKSTVWVNGTPMQEGAAKTPPVQGVDAVVNGKRLQVGESVDALTGARADVVAPGAVTVRRAK